MDLMTGTVPLLLFLLTASQVLADGFTSMPLRQVLLETDVILLARIEENKGTTTRQGHGDGRESHVYTNDIRSRVISTHFGTFTGGEYNTIFSLILVKGVWEGIPGSGLEVRMSAGETVVLMLKNTDDGYRLLRAEKAEKLQEVLHVRRELDEEDRRVADEQVRIPNGIYHYSDVSEAQKVRLQDGRRVQIGGACKFDIVRKEIYARYHTVLLCLTLTGDKPGHCVLMVEGKAYWLFDHHWAARETEPGPEHPPRLYCSFKDRKDVEAVAASLGIAISDSEGWTAESRANE